MSTFFKSRLAVAALLLGPAVSMAAYAPSGPVAVFEPESAAPAWIAAVPSQGALAAGFLARSVAQVGPSDTVRKLAGETDAMKSALATKPFGTPVFGNLRGNAGLLLWNLSAVVRAQQDRQVFELVDVGITALHISEDIARVSAVPLPGAVWLFVMAVLGLAGTRVTGIKPGRAATRANDGNAPWLPQSAPVPA